MENDKLLRNALLASTSVILLGGCLVEDDGRYRHGPPRAVVVEPAVSAEVVVSEAPPPVIVEERPVAPGVGFVWIPGVYVWEGHWRWERGHWDRPPRRGAVWVPHRYEYRNGRHVFVRGGWR